MRIKIILLLFIITSCSPRYKLLIQDKKEKPLDSQQEVLVLSKESDINLNGASLIGEIKGPFEKFYTSPKEVLKGCGYTEIINDLKNQSKQLGANIISIYELKKPTSLDNCYNIKARLYRSFDKSLIENINKLNYSKNKSKLDKNANYALIHFYRPKAVNGMIVKFDIYMDNNIFITKLENGHKTSYKITDFGTHLFSGINQKEQKKEFTLDVKKGQEYYIRCGVDIGRKHGTAQFSLLDNEIGDLEFKKMK